MRTIIVALMLGFLSSQIYADGRVTWCFDADTNASFLTSEDVALGGSFDTRMPRVESNSDGKPTKLIWMPRPDEMSISVQQIGRYCGKGIYRILYQEKGAASEALEPQFTCLIFGYQTATSQSVNVRPFFVAFGDDQTKWGVPIFAADKDQKFALEIGRSFSGNGVYWEDYTFVFTANEACLLQRSEGSRKTRTKTHRYNKAGKITATKISTSE